MEQSSFRKDSWERDQFLDYLAQPRQCVFVVALIAGRVVGYGLAFHNKRGADIDLIAVIPAQRGKGIALALMRRLIGTLRRRGFRKVSLNVRLENKAAIQLYRKPGFERVRRMNGYYADGAPSWRMRRSE